MHLETSAGFHKKLLKRKQSNLKSILVFERQKKQTKKAITAVKEKVAVKHGQQTFLTLLLGGCMYALNLSRRSCAVSITYWEERIRISSTGPATGHDALVTEPVCGGERENVERSDGGWVTGKDCRGVLCWERGKHPNLEEHLRLRIPLTTQPEVTPSL